MNSMQFLANGVLEESTDPCITHINVLESEHGGEGNSVSIIERGDSEVLFEVNALELFQ